MTSHSYDFHKSRVQGYGKNKLHRAMKLAQDDGLMTILDDSHRAPPHKLITDAQRANNIARQLWVKERTNRIGVQTAYQERDATVIEPFYRDPRNVMISNLVRQFSVPVKNGHTVKTNLMVYFLIAGGFWYTGRLESFMLVQSAYTLLDVLLESLPIDKVYRNAAVGGGLEDYFLLTRQW